MATAAVTTPIKKLKKLRSLDEIRTRGSQAFSAYREQLKGPTGLPSDEKFNRSVDASFFKGTPILAETLWQRFYKHGEQHFFPVFKGATLSAEAFRKHLGKSVAQRFIDSADAILDGRINLMGLAGVYVGTDVDWHREPISAKRSPEKHWKEFDELDCSETGNKKIIWELNRHQHFFTLGVAYWLTRDERYAAAFARHLGSWIEQDPPSIGINWSSSLEVAFRAMSWLWAFHFFERSEAFTPELFKLALKSLYCHGRHIEQYLSTYYSPNTHLTGEGLGLYYLGTQLPFFDRSQKWRELGEDILLSEIGKQISPDGVYFEQSTCYQRYTADFYSHFAVLRSLNSGLSDRSDDEVEERLHSCIRFLMHCQMPNGRTPLIGDDDGGQALPLTTAAPDDLRGSVAVGALLLADPELKFAAGSATEEIFWLCGPAGVRSYKALSQEEPRSASVSFRNGGYAVMRDGWSGTDNWMLIDCGDVGALSGGHGHADTLSITAAAHGRPLLVDSGTYTYHDSKELRDYFRSSAAHNTLTVDDLSSSLPGQTFNWETRANAEWESWTAEERFDHFRGSHDGFQRLADPVSHSREVLFLKGDYWAVIDRAGAKEHHDYTLHFHLSDKLDTRLDSEAGCIGGTDHRIYTFGDHGHWEQKEAWISTVHANRKNAPYFRFVSSGHGPQEFVTFILPFSDADAPVVEEMPMTGGRAFALRYCGYTDIMLINDDRDHVLDNGIFESDAALAWARLRDGHDRPDEIVLINCHHLSLHGDPVITDGPLEFASLRRFGSDLYLKTDLGRSVVTLRK